MRTSGPGLVLTAFALLAAAGCGRHEAQPKSREAASEALPQLDACGPSLDLEARMKEAQALGLKKLDRPAFNSEFADPETLDFEAFFACKGLSSGKVADSCSAFDGLGKSFVESARTCRDIGSSAGFIWATLKGGDAQRSCREYVGDLRLKGDAPDRLCGLLIAALKGGQDAGALCGAIGGSGAVRGKELRQCPQALLYVEGRPEKCAGLSDLKSRYHCRELSMLVSTLRSGGRDACKASPLCSAISTHDPGACSGYRGAAERIFCEKHGHQRMR